MFSIHPESSQLREHAPCVRSEPSTKESGNDHQETP